MYGNTKIFDCHPERSEAESKDLKPYRIVRFRFFASLRMTDF